MFIYIYMYIYMNIYVCIYIHVYIYMYVCVHIHIYAYTYIYTYILYICRHMHIYIPSYFQNTLPCSPNTGEVINMIAAHERVAGSARESTHTNVGLPHEGHAHERWATSHSLVADVKYTMRRCIIRSLL